MFSLLKKTWDNSKIISAIEGIIKEYENNNILEVQKWYYYLYKEAYKQAIRDGISVERIINDAANILPNEKYDRYIKILEFLSRKGGPLEEVDEYFDKITKKSKDRNLEEMVYYEALDKFDYKERKPENKLIIDREKSKKTTNSNKVNKKFEWRKEKYKSELETNKPIKQTKDEKDYTKINASEIIIFIVSCIILAFFISISIAT